MKHTIRTTWRCSVRLIAVLTLFLSFLPQAGCSRTPDVVNRMAPVRPQELDLIEQEINSYVPDPRFPDDRCILVTIREGLRGARERNGGIGACLVRKESGEIIEQTHNRQYEPYFRSDLHAEMDLLDRYEERSRLTRSRDPRDATYRNPRNMKGIVLYTSVEPCPMCLTRIINSGLKELYYAAPDEDGGMSRRIESLPPSWKRMAEGMIHGPARCSPRLKALAASLFRPMYAAGMQKR